MEPPRPFSPEDDAALESLLADPGPAPEPSPTVEQVLRARYLLKDAEGRVAESWDGLCRRVSAHVSRAEQSTGSQALWEGRFERLMRERIFLPNSPTLMNAGLGSAQLAACFVLPVEDSISSIFESVRDMALVQKTGGGTGFSFSRLRPAGDLVATTQSQSSGPLTFMDVFNAATDSIRQGGRRRGANMGVLEVHHPDILRFITRKLDPARLTNFNLSVGLTAAFFEAHERGGEFDLVNPRSGEPTGKLSAARVLTLIARAACLGGEPGLLFLDRINEDNPTPELGEISSTNPCGELPLLPFESCNLGSLSLARFLRQGEIDWQGLAAAVHAAIRLLDDVIDTTHFPLPEVAKATLATRKVGLGLMGFADLLITLGIPYASDEALALGDRLMAFMARESHRASETLALTKGPFPAFAGSRIARRGDPPRRNATTNTIAPTGTISILAGCSAGIEPLFAPVYRRRFLDGRETLEVHPLFAERLSRRGLDRPELIERIAAAGHARVEGVPEDLARLFATAHEVPPHRHVEMQAAFQRHVDNSVSKTVNLPQDALAEEVEELFLLARRLECKGLTIYRDRSRDEQVLSSLSDSPPAREPSSTRRPGESCPSCGGVLEGSGPLIVCYRCAWSE